MAKSIAGNRTMGIDLGDEYSHYAIVGAGAEKEREGRVRTREREIRRLIREAGDCRTVIEAGTHSGWVSRLLTAAGRETYVANPRQLPAIYGSVKKTDRTDAEMLARIGRLDPELLKPVQHRELERQKDLAVVRQREKLRQTRTTLIGSVRGTLKQFGIRTGGGTARTFAKRAGAATPQELKKAIGPTLRVIESLNKQIACMEREIERLGRESYPESGVLRQIPGVGPITSLTYVLVMENPKRFADNRQAGAYLGLTPRKDQSGERDRQLGITKAGDRMLRSLLVNCAQYMLGPFGADSEIRRLGERISAQGGSNARKRAVVAMARKLSVVMMSLWRTGEVYEPFYSRPEAA